ncbi:hypothetical protein [Halobaculum limi]|uniref:hypothetical protein n=1 Tax=Halobaculum limi TaxID=3031916 RepID=UPI0024049F88|nr:hypothetical protein [Halobaculum sp. YSMS11]
MRRPTREDEDSRSDGRCDTDGRDEDGANAREVVAVAVLFAVLGGALVRFGAAGTPPGVVWTAVAVVVVAAATVAFGADAVTTAFDGLRR